MICFDRHDRSVNPEEALKAFHRQLAGKVDAPIHPRYAHAVSPEKALEAFYKQIGREA